MYVADEASYVNEGASIFGPSSESLRRMVVKPPIGVCFVVSLEMAIKFESFLKVFKAYSHIRRHC